MFQMNQYQVEKVAKLIARPEERDAFSQWLAFINDKVLKAEQQNLKRQYEGYFKKNITKGIDVEAYKESRGEFERLLWAIWEAATKQQNYTAVNNLVGALLGIFWEWQFCNLSDEGDFLVYWFQKWEPLGAPRFAKGKPIPEWGKGTPDVMFIVNKHWVFGGIKHVASEGDTYEINPSDWNRIKELIKYKPLIPYWSIINDHERLGKWSTVSDWQDWFVFKFDEATELEHRGTSGPTWTGERGARLLPKEWFRPLKDVLEELRGSE